MAEGGSITFGGIASGLKTDEIIGAMVEGSKTHMRHVEKQTAKLEVHRSTYERVAQLARELEKVAQPLTTSASHTTQQASSSNEAVLRATAGEGAMPGTFMVEVVRLATGQRSHSNGVDSREGPSHLSAGTLRWHSGDQDFSVAVAEGASLKSVADQLNGSGGGLHASIVFDGSQHRLQLTGSAVGAHGGLAFEADPTGLGLDDPENLVQPAQDCLLVLDNKMQITRPKNIVNDVLHGVTLNLEDEGGPVRVRVTTDHRAVVGQITDFVDAFNAVITAVDEATHSEGAAKLAGDSTLRNLARSLHEAVSRPVRNLNQPYKSLSSIGISTTREGTLSVETSRLEDAVTHQGAQVAHLFGRDVHAGSRGVAIMLQDIVRQYAPVGSGHLASKQKRIDQQTEALGKRHAQMQVHAERYEQNLRKQFSEHEKNMAKLQGQNSFMQAQLNNGNKK